MFFIYLPTKQFPLVIGRYSWISSYSKLGFHCIYRLSTRLPYRSVSEVRATVATASDAASYTNRRYAASSRGITSPTRLLPTVPCASQNHAELIPLRQAGPQLHLPRSALRSTASRKPPPVGPLPRNVGQSMDQERGAIPPLTEIPSDGAKNAREKPSPDESTGRPRSETQETVHLQILQPTIHEILQPAHPWKDSHRRKTILVRYLRKGLQKTRPS